MSFPRLLPWPLLFLAVVSIPTLAQQNGPPTFGLIPPPTELASGTPFQDRRAVATIRRALDALGGINAISQVQSSQITAQSHSPNGKGTVPVSWEGSGAEWRVTVTVGNSSFTTLTGHGNPAYVFPNGMAAKIPAHVIRAQFVPALVGSILLGQLQNTGYSLLYSGQASLSRGQTAGLTGNPAQQFTVIKTGVFSRNRADKVTLQTWYFDQTSGLPVRVEFQMPSHVRPDVSSVGAYNFGQYQSVSGVMYPFQLSRYFGSRLLEAVTVQSVLVNPVIPVSDFDSPATPQ